MEQKTANIVVLRHISDAECFSFVFREKVTLTAGSLVIAGLTISNTALTIIGGILLALMALLASDSTVSTKEARFV